MQCPKCGWQNPDDATKCSNCFTEFGPSAPQPTQQMPQQPYAQQTQQAYGQQPYGQVAGQVLVQNVPDYLVWSIVVTAVSLICCWSLPSVAFGIVAMVKASSANNRKLTGDLVGALREANASKTWMLWSAGLAIVAPFAILALLFLLGLIGNSMSPQS